MIPRTTPGIVPDGRSEPFYTNVIITNGDKAGDVGLIVAVFVILLVLITIGLLTAILRDEIQNLYVVDPLNPEED